MSTSVETSVPRAATTAFSALLDQTFVKSVRKALSCREANVKGSGSPVPVTNSCKMASTLTARTTVKNVSRLMIVLSVVQAHS